MAGVPFMRSGGRCSRYKTWAPRVQIAKAAVAGDYIRHALFDRAILAIPIDVAHAEIDDRTPRRVARRVTRRSAEHQARRQAGSNYRNFTRGFHYLTCFCFAARDHTEEVSMCG